MFLRVSRSRMCAPAQSLLMYNWWLTHAAESKQPSQNLQAMMNNARMRAAQPSWWLSCPGLPPLPGSFAAVALLAASAARESSLPIARFSSLPPTWLLRKQPSNKQIATGGRPPLSWCCLRWLAWWLRSRTLLRAERPHRRPPPHHLISRPGSQAGRSEEGGRGHGIFASGAFELQPKASPAAA
jgi:hypothetical protein